MSFSMRVQKLLYRQQKDDTCGLSAITKPLPMTDKIKHSKSTLPVLGIVLAFVAFAVSASIIPPLITTMADEIEVNYTNFGYIVMLQYFGFFISGIIGGWLCEHYRINNRAFILVGLSIVSLAMFTAPILTRLLWFAIWAIPFGFGGGLVQIFGSILISHYEKPNSSKLLNMSQVFFCIGAISAFQVVAFMLYLKMSWEHIFILFGLFISLIFFVFLLLTEKDPQPTVRSVQATNNSPTFLLKDPLFFMLAATLLIFVTSDGIIVCWVSVYFEKQLSCSVPSSALRLSIYWIGLVLGRSAIIFLPARFTLWPAFFTCVVIMFVSSLFASFTFSPILVSIFIFLCGFGSGPVWPITVAICHTIRNRPKFTSSVISIGSVGAVVGSAMGSGIFKYLDSSLFFPAISAVCFVLLTLSFLSYRKFQNCNSEILSESTTS